MSHLDITQANPEPAVPTPELPAQIGPYRILRQIGRGGMGVVYLGESDTPKRQAAIKLMLSDHFDGEGLARFRREMDVLARLEHPGIARLYEAGDAELGGTRRPWFAMEYIEGLALDDHVRERQLAPKAVFALVAQVARALHFAHQRGVIHRDIKPANILVDAHGQPKILDFGIARLNEEEAGGIKTRFGQIIGTLAYMSPEQLSGSRHADVRSDVYALGVVLYQLLCGELPIRIGTTSLIEAIKELSEGRRTRLGERDPKFRGEVELIVDTACQRDVEHRYDSAASFAGDLEAFLRNRPLTARKPSWTYVFGKFVRRNPVFVGAIALAVTSLVAATVLSMQAADRARQAEGRAEARAAETEAVIGFLTDAIRDAAPDQARGRDLKLTEVLDALSAQRVGKSSGSIETKLRSTLFETRVAMADFDAAKKELDRLDTLCASANPHPDCVIRDARSARLLTLTGQIEQALPKHLAAIAAAKSAHVAPAVLDGLEIEYADALNQGGQSEASAALLRQIESRMGQRGHVDARTQLQVSNLLADALGEFGKIDEAEAVMKAAIPPAEAGLGADHPSVLLARNSLITYRVDRGDYTTAVTEFSALLADAEKTLGPEHRTTMTILGNLGASQFFAGQPDAAETTLTRRDEVFARRYAGDWRSRLNNLVSLSSIQNGRGKYQEALDRLDAALAGIPEGAAFAAEWANALSWRGWFLRQLKRTDESEAQYRSLIDRFVTTFGEGDVQLARYRMRLAGTLIDQKGYAEAKVLLEKALPELVAAYGEEHTSVKEARTNLARALEGS